MNQRLPYEQLIADKLQELNLPGRENSWQKMKALLDEEMPEAGNDKKNGFVKWRNISLLILLITAATISIIYFSNSKQQDTRNITSATVVQHNTAGSTSQDILPDENTTAKENIKANTAPAKPVVKNTPSKAISNSTTIPAIVELKTNNTANNNYTDENIVTNVNTSSGRDKAISLHPNSQVSADQERTNYLQEPTADSEGRELLFGNNGNNITNSEEITGILAKAEKDIFPALQQNTTVTVPDYVWQLPNVAEKKKAILKEMKRQERKNERELAKSYKNHWSFWGNHTDRWFAAGIAPYQNFSIASQQTYNYNSGAGKNMIADYIPSPYLQLHVTDRIYLLSEFQFNSPQATPSLLLAQNKASIPMSNTNYTENIYLKKLYYFNMPVSFYYSPVKNFYIGSGLQFSSFNSGLVYREQLSSNNTILESQTFKIKEDSLSSKINASEWRYLFDANYYANRFMFGFRYNQAINNFVNLKVNNILPPTQARNQAFQFYIRYNLVVSKRN